MLEPCTRQALRPLPAGPAGLSRMGNVAVQCPVCRSWGVFKRWQYANPYYQCGACGHVWR